MNKGKILITPRSLSKSGHPELEALRGAGYEVLTPFPGKSPTEEELLTVLPGCIGFLAGVEKIGPDVLEKCNDLRVISRNGVGIDNVDRKTAEKKGIALKITPGANSRGVAELTIGLLFSAIRTIPQINNSVKNGGWERTKGMEVQGKTLGVIGTGMIGREVIAMATGLGMNVLAYDLYPHDSLENRKNVAYVSLKEVYAGSDIITLHCPAGEKPLIDADVLNSMKKGAYLINTARAALVDEEALLNALEGDTISGYAVDAFAREPPELTPLLKHPAVLTTAHIGGFTEESVYRATKAAVENILEVLE